MSSQQKTGLAIHISGIVQGVGFRPFVYRLATRLGIAGSVRNDGEGVRIEAFAAPAALGSFQQELARNAPPLARIDTFVSFPLLSENFTEPPEQGRFVILFSGETCGAQAAIPADIALCPQCAADISDPGNRRYNYPFTSCTDCGPRYTIVSEVPYDRPLTSMSRFTMCRLCQEEYDNPADRRFHAQPNACPLCGPQLTANVADEPLVAAAAALAAGKIVAICGLGGYQLAVDACNVEAVDRLRQRKNRPEKPFAIMVHEEKRLWEISSPTSRELELLRSAQSPIVLLARKESSPLAGNLAINIGEIGVMLPYTPLHQLLFAVPVCPAFLVMTSGNIHNNPISRTRQEAEAELAEIADLFLDHNREILTRVDDSVARVVGGKTTLIRRSRGYAPNSLDIQQQLPPLVACGAALKNTFCLAHRKKIVVSQHIGTLDNPSTFDFFLETLTHLKKLYHIEPEMVACDLHPDYPSSLFARELGLPLFRVQHHHAHAASVMAEHHLDQALAIVLDGTGLGDDGTIWGGEILALAGCGYERLGHLAPISLPGGDRAVEEPWRMALAALYDCGIGTLPSTLTGIDREKTAKVQSLLSSDFSFLQTSSVGRLFDAAASLLGLRHQVSYEGQAAMELEFIASRALTQKVPEWLENVSLSAEKYGTLRHGKWQITPRKIVMRLVDGLARKKPAATLALDFHHMLIGAFASVVVDLARERNIDKVVLCGGCMQNRLLLEGFTCLLGKNNLQVFAGEALPMNDGGLSAGQAIIGGMRYVSGNSNEGDRC